MRVSYFVSCCLSPMPFVWTKEHIQTAIELWNSGKSGREVAEVIHAPSRGAVTRKISRLRAQGIPVETRPSPIRPGPASPEAGVFAWTTENIQAAVELWSQGKTGRQIAEAICAPSPGSVRRKLGHLRARGLAVVPRRPVVSPKPMNSGAEFPVERPVAPDRRDDGAVLLVDAELRQCRFPLWNARSDPKLVCGKKTVNAMSSWCEEHERLVWKTHDHPLGKLRPPLERDDRAVIDLGHPLTAE